MCASEGAYLTEYEAEFMLNNVVWKKAKLNAPKQLTNKFWNASSNKIILYFLKIRFLIY